MGMLTRGTDASAEPLTGRSGNAAEHDRPPSGRPRFRFRMHPAVVMNRRAKGKRCRDCKQFRFPTARWFHRDKNRPDGFQLYCKVCKRERDRRSYLRHREERQAARRAWKSEHRDHINAWHRVYVKEYRRGDRRRGCFYPEEAEPGPAPLKLCSACGDAFPLSEFPRRGHECRSCWNRRQPKYRNPTKRAVYRQNRRARERGRITSADWLAVLERHGHPCAYCGTDGPLTMDHVIPLAKGGAHDPSNIVPACRRCNSRKDSQTWSPATGGNVAQPDE